MTTAGRGGRSRGAGYHAFSFGRTGKVGWGVGERGAIGKLIW